MIELRMVVQGLNANGPDAVGVVFRSEDKPVTSPNGVPLGPNSFVNNLTLIMSTEDAQKHGFFPGNVVDVKIMKGK